MSDCHTAAAELLARHPIRANAWFAALCDGTMDRAAFIASQRQFFHAVRFFSRPMAALMARLPDSASRAPLMHNLAEEHGLADDGSFRVEMAHDRTFTAFLATLAAEPSPDEGPAVRAFNLALLGACTTEPPAFAFACLGMVEFMFAKISTFIGKAVIERGWLAPQELVHYGLHAELDHQHAAEFFDAAGSASEARDGLAFGRYIFDRLYTELHPAR